MFLANFLYTFEINIRASIILGYVGAGGYGYTLESECIENEQYDRIGCLLIPLFILVFTLQVASNIVSRKLK
jgi:phosphonate transport system permease protein